MTSREQKRFSGNDKVWIYSDGFFWEKAEGKRNKPMAFDGIMLAGLAAELQEKLTGGRVTKIAQTESDKLILTVKISETDSDGKLCHTQSRLVISANPSLPLIYLTRDSENSPLQAPTFCMVLRKYLNNCRIDGIRQIGLERVLCFDLAHVSEMGDHCKKRLYVELMGKHSNIIFCDDSDNIVDSIKHIPASVSSVREVLPGKDYFIPNTREKKDPFTLSENDFLAMFAQSQPIEKAIGGQITGFSYVMANEMIYRAGLSDYRSTEELNEGQKLDLYHVFAQCMADVAEKKFHPNIVFLGDEPKEFASVSFTSYQSREGYRIKPYESVSTLLYEYYNAKETADRIRQKSADLRRITQTALERNLKKYDLQKKQWEDTKKRDKYKVCGELLTTYGYSLTGGEKSFTCDNYYTQQPITIPLDPALDAMENAKRYFAKYTKLKRTYEALGVQIKETKDEIYHLESIQNALEIARSREDLDAIRRELYEAGYLKRQESKNAKKKGNGASKAVKSKPLHYRSADGFDIYVGKNNAQNDALTFQLATGNDWWFHAKGNAGSHVIVKTNGQELPDRTFEEAARLAAFYSKSRDQEKAEIDYVQKKHVKKPNGAKPGFVVYYTNYSMTIPTDITGIAEVSD